jgi:hypothetical protein
MKMKLTADAKTGDAELLKKQNCYGCKAKADLKLLKNKLLGCKETKLC